MFFTNRLRKFVVGGLAALCLMTAPQMVYSQELEAVSFEPAIGPAFDLIVDGESQAVTLAEIEGLGMYRTTTTSPWEAGTFTFEGPMLRDVLTYLGVEDEPQLLLRAIDGFTATIPQVDWMDGPLLLATRRDGETLNRRAQGPTRIVYPQTEFPAYAAPEYKSRWIWLIASIETVQ